MVDRKDTNIIIRSVAEMAFAIVVFVAALAISPTLEIGLINASYALRKF